MGNNHKYIWDDRYLFTINAAIACNRPLLIRGEPGIGKSSLAREAARKLERHFICDVITAKTEPNDLLWQFDGVMRLGEATMTCNMEYQQIKRLLDRQNYTSPGVLWWAFQSTQALIQYNACPSGVCPSSDVRRTLQEQIEKSAQDTTGWVVLIDEIDKADSDVPNSLLGALSDGEFSVPGFDTPVRQDTQDTQDTSVKAPLIIVTTNEERELPPAFLRRCFVLQMDFPSDVKDTSTEEVISWLTERAEVHLKDDSHPDIMDSMPEIADMLLKERSNTTGRHKPGLSEFIDFVCAFDEMLKAEQKENSPRSKDDILKLIASFTLKKNARP